MPQPPRSEQALLQLSLLAAFLLTAVAPSELLAQQDAPCSTSWAPGAGVPGVDGSVHQALAWIPAGAVNEHLVFGGSFTHAERLAANNVASYDPATGEWSDLGGGVNGLVLSFLGLPNGDLLVGGVFSMAGGVAVNNLARWDGTAWHDFAGGITSAGSPSVQDLARMPNGDIVVSGFFTSAGGQAVAQLARWDGTTWSGYGLSATTTLVRAMLVMPNGDLVVAGNFAMIAGTPAENIANWNGTAWTSFGTGLSHPAKSLARRPGGGFVTTGSFSSAGDTSAHRVAQWDGQSWSAMGSGFTTAGDVVQLANGEIVLVSHTLGKIARWNGTQWLSIGADVVGSVYALAPLANGSLAIAGNISQVAGIGLENVAHWDGSQWSAMAVGTDNSVYAFAALADGGLIAGGAFDTIEGVAAHRIARRTATGWQPLGLGMNGDVRAIAELPNGDLVVTGLFTTAGTVAASRVARWDGATWHAMGTGFSNAGGAILVEPNGDVIVGGAFDLADGAIVDGIARWDGNNWHGMAQGLGSSVRSLAHMPNGDIVAGGSFYPNVFTPNMPSRIARWDGSTWQPLGPGLTISFGNAYVSALAVLPTGELIAGGQFNQAGGVYTPGLAQWDGSQWSPVSAGFSYIHDLRVLPDGDLVVSGSFNTGMQRRDRLTGQWTMFRGGTDGAVVATELTANGDFYIGGQFATAGGEISKNIARLDNNCTARAKNFAPSCIGPAGPMTLTADALPWIGGPYRATATGFAPTTLGLGVIGFGEQTTLLSSLHPTGTPGCDLLTSPDYLQLLLPTAGEVTMEITIPDSPSLAGIELRQQLLQIELGTALQIDSITGSNGLELTIGHIEQ